VAFFDRSRVMRSGCCLLVAFVTGCGWMPTESAEPTTPTVPARTEDPDSTPDPPPLPAEVAELEVAITAVSPFCCEPLEREFAVTIDGEAPPASAVCVWDFGDNRSNEGCATVHRYIYTETYEVTVSITLAGGALLLETFQLDLAARGSDLDEGEKRLTVDAGEDVQAAPGEFVQLAGKIETDYGPGDVLVTWTQVDGPAVRLIDAETASPSLLVPETVVDALLVFRLTAATADRAVSDTVTVEVLADAPAQQTGELVPFVAGDATDAIQGAIDSGASVVVVPNVGEPWVVRPLFLRSNLHLVLKPGVVLEAKRNEFHDMHDSVLTAFEVENVYVEAYGAIIRMHKSDYVSDAYEPSEWRHGVELQGAANVEIAGLHVEQSGGDGMYVGSTWDSRRVISRDVLVRDCVMVDNYRNGMTIAAAENLVVEDCLFSDTSGTAPQAGLLVEPGDRPDHLRNVRVRNCVARGNAGTGIMANLTKHSNLSDPVDVIIEDCTVVDSVQPGLRAILREHIGATGRFEFRRCAVTGTRHAGVKIIWDVGSPVELLWTECSWTDVARDDGWWPVDLELTRSGDLARSAGITFTECQLDNDRHASIVRLSVDGAPDAPEIGGTIRIGGLKPDELNSPRLPNLEITHEDP